MPDKIRETVSLDSLGEFTGKKGQAKYEGWVVDVMYTTTPEFVYIVFKEPPSGARVPRPSPKPVRLSDLSDVTE